MSEIKVNKISPRAACGTVTLGDSGDTFTIPSGATINNQGTALNFGATGSASWVTTVKTSTFTATAGEGYFCNTTGGAFTVNLPAGSAGAVVAIKDYASTFDSNALTIAPNGSDKIGASNDDVVMTEAGIAITLIFVDSTQGWLVTDSGLQSEAQVPKFIAASGGTVTTSGNFKIHTFTGPGTFTVSCAGNASGSTTVDYLVVAGGGSGGTRYAGGGGGGGYRESSGGASGCYAISPRGSGVAALSVTATGFPITVGGGGTGVAESPAPSCKTGNRGSNSVFSTITSTGGGGGIKQGSTAPAEPLSPGGSGGGGSYNAGPAGVGNTPPVNPVQGSNGGTGIGNPHYAAGGGGGATETGVAGNTSSSGRGGAGATSCITGSPVGRSGGGGAGYSINHPVAAGAASPCGSGTGGGTSPGSTTSNGAANRGGGSGGGYAYPGDSGNGGSGIVVIRYKFQ
jgi:hypothetical protein